VLDRGVVFAEAKRWLAGTPIDPCTLRPIQVTYTAAPLFHDGLVDPLGERLGVLDGEHELVAVPDIHVQQPEYDRAGHATYGPAQSAEGLGLLPSPRLDAALERLAGTGGATGSVRWALLQAAFDYAKDVGRDHVDVEALADALAEAAAPYRSAAEIAGYGLEGLIGWALARVPPETADGTPPPGLPPYFDGGEQDPTEASATLRLTVANFVEQGLAYDGKGKPPRDAIAGGVGLGKTTITLQMLAQMAQGRTVHYYAPTLELGAEVVSKAQAHGLDAVLVRGREANKKDPARWPALCLKDDVASTLGGLGRNVWESLCRKEDDFGNVTTCEYFHGCAYVHQFDNLDGRLIVLAHEYLALPKTLIAKPALVVVDERFHTTLIGKPSSLPLERVTAQRVPPKDGGHFRQLSTDARRAVQAIESGKTMVEIGLTPERLREMARDEERMAEPPTIWPDMPYAEQRSRAQRLAEIEAFRLAKLWRVLAKDNDRVSQRVVIARGIEWKGERADRVFIHKAKALAIPKGLPVLLLDADHDPLIGAATLPTKRRTVIQPRLNAEVIQVWDTACSKNKLLETATRRDQVLALARQEAAQGRRVLIGTYKPVADLLRAALDEQPNPSIDVAHFGAIRGLDGWKDFDTVIVAGREQLRPTDAENKARALFGADPEPLLLTGEYVPQMRGHRTKDGSRTAVAVQVHPDLRVQALVEQAREREVEQMVGRLRLVHREWPARVFLLSNVPTTLPVDRLTTWGELMPNKIEQAILAGRGVVPLSYSELARAHPSLWAKAERARNSFRGKGGENPIRYSYWENTTLFAATEVTYRLPGQARGSPHKAIIPGKVTDPDAARRALVPLLGPVEAVQIGETFYRPTVVVEDAGDPAPLTIPLVLLPPRVHVLHIDEAWAIGPDRLERWNLHSGHQILMPVELGRDVQLASNVGGAPTSFARANPSG
jgi:hypothetical protein